MNLILACPAGRVARSARGYGAEGRERQRVAAPAAK